MTSSAKYKRLDSLGDWPAAPCTWEPSYRNRVGEAAAVEHGVSLVGSRTRRIGNIR